MNEINNLIKNNYDLFNIITYYFRWENQEKENILHFSSFYNRIDICQALISNNFDISQLTKKNNNALHYSSTNDNPIISMLLVKNNLNYLQKNIFGQLPIHFTANQGLAWYYRQLLKRKNINIVDLIDYDGNNVAHSARIYKNLNIYNYWIKEIPELLNMKNKLGLKPNEIFFFKKYDFCLTN